MPRGGDLRDVEALPLREDREAGLRVVGGRVVVGALDVGLEEAGERDGAAGGDELGRRGLAAGQLGRDEGRLDAQTAMGKAPIGVAKLAKQYGAKVIALAGCTTEDAGECNRQGIDAFFSIVDKAMPLQEAMDRDTAIGNMTRTAQQVFNLIRAVS